eukprot:TRINITY_DN832_c0_g1_i1.p1 TRINITY_DN832_c0_g1~~TRINITY_DN832_c0_g1_i1.p1  ORF type:complete len:2216 (-),score=718.29 TRINITY_DN832_c0_g1_i1:15-6662(-)
MGLVWTIILHYQINGRMRKQIPNDKGSEQAQKKNEPKSADFRASTRGNPVGQRELLTWIDEQLAPYGIAPISGSITSSFSDGVVLTALVDSLEPGTFGFSRSQLKSSLNPNQADENTRKAIELANSKFKIPTLVEAQDLTSGEIDEHSVLTYLSFFRDYASGNLRSRSPRSSPRQNTETVVEQPKAVPKATPTHTDVNHQNYKINSYRFVKIERFNALAGAGNQTHYYGIAANSGSHQRYLLRQALPSSSEPEVQLNEGFSFNVENGDPINFELVEYSNDTGAETVLNKYAFNPYHRSVSTPHSQPESHSIPLQNGSNLIIESSLHPTHTSELPPLATEGDRTRPFVPAQSATVSEPELTEEDVRNALKEVQGNRGDVKASDGSDITFSVSMKGATGAAISGAEDKFKVKIAGRAGPRNDPNGKIAFVKDPPPTITEKEEGSYSIGFKPPGEGIWLVWVTYQNKPLRARPFVIFVDKEEESSSSEDEEVTPREPATSEADIDELLSNVLKTKSVTNGDGSDDIERYSSLEGYVGSNIQIKVTLRDGKERPLVGAKERISIKIRSDVDETGKSQGGKEEEYGVEDQGDGSYLVELSGLGKREGWYACAVFLDGKLFRKPYLIHVVRPIEKSSSTVLIRGSKKAEEDESDDTTGDETTEDEASGDSTSEDSSSEDSDGEKKKKKGKGKQSESESEQDEDDKSLQAGLEASKKQEEEERRLREEAEENDRKQRELLAAQMAAEAHRLQEEEERKRREAEESERHQRELLAAQMAAEAHRLQEEEEERKRREAAAAEEQRQREEEEERRRKEAAAAEEQRQREEEERRRAAEAEAQRQREEEEQRKRREAAAEEQRQKEAAEAQRRKEEQERAAAAEAQKLRELEEAQRKLEHDEELRRQAAAEAAAEAKRLHDEQERAEQYRRAEEERRQKEADEAEAQRQRELAAADAQKLRELEEAQRKLEHDEELKKQAAAEAAAEAKRREAASNTSESDTSDSESSSDSSDDGKASKNNVAAGGSSDDISSAHPRDGNPSEAASDYSEQNKTDIKTETGAPVLPQKKESDEETDSSSDSSEEDVASIKQADSQLIEVDQTPARDISSSSDTSRYNLIITVLSGHNLPAKDFGGTSDPFVILQHKTLSQVEYATTHYIYSHSAVKDEPGAQKTTIKKKTVNPVWNQSFNFEMKHENRDQDFIVLNTFDHDKLTKNDYMCTSNLNVSNIIKAEKNKIHEMELSTGDYSKGKVKPLKGIIKILVQWKDYNDGQIKQNFIEKRENADRYFVYSEHDRYLSAKASGVDPNKKSKHVVMTIVGLARIPFNPKNKSHNEVYVRTRAGKYEGLSQRYEIVDDKGKGRAEVRESFQFEMPADEGEEANLQILRGDEVNAGSVQVNLDKELAKGDQSGAQVYRIHTPGGEDDDEGEIYVLWRFADQEAVLSDAKASSSRKSKGKNKSKPMVYGDHEAVIKPNWWLDTTHEDSRSKKAIKTKDEEPSSKAQKGGDTLNVEIKSISCNAEDADGNVVVETRLFNEKHNTQGKVTREGKNKINVSQFSDNNMEFNVADRKGAQKGDLLFTILDDENNTIGSSHLTLAEIETTPRDEAGYLLIKIYSLESSEIGIMKILLSSNHYYAIVTVISAHNLPTSDEEEEDDESALVEILDDGEKPLYKTNAKSIDSNTVWNESYTYSLNDTNNNSANRGRVVNMRVLKAAEDGQGQSGSSSGDNYGTVKYEIPADRVLYNTVETRDLVAGKPDQGQLKFIITMLPFQPSESDFGHKVYAGHAEFVDKDDVQVDVEINNGKSGKKKSKKGKKNESDTSASVDITATSANEAGTPGPGNPEGEISVSMSPAKSGANAMEVTYMKLMMLGARNFEFKKPPPSKTEVYAALQLGEAQFRTQASEITPSVVSPVNPKPVGSEVKWNEAFLLQLQGDWKTQDMEVIVMREEGDENLGSTRTHLGEAMKNIGMGEEKNFELLIDNDKGKGNGVVIFGITLYSSPPDGFEIDANGEGMAEEDEGTKAGEKDESGSEIRKRGTKKAATGTTEKTDVRDVKGKKEEESGEVEIKRTKRKLEGTDQEVDAWLGGKTFWNKKKEEKYILTVYDVKIGGSGEVDVRLYFENKTKGSIRNKGMTAWIRTHKEGKEKGKGKNKKKELVVKNGKKEKVKGTQKEASGEKTVKVPIPEFSKGEIRTCLLVVRADFKGVHNNMTLLIDISEFVPSDKLAS